ncbi:unnamed protein product [Victoria cruziana]
MEDDEVTSDQINKRENIVWADNEIDYLVHCLIEQARMPGMRVKGGLKGRAMTAIEKKMIEKFGPEFTKEKIKNKLKYVKPNLTICKEILETSGFNWDPVKKCIDVDDNVWRDYIQKYPDRKRYRNAQKWKYFEEFQEVYGDSSAICEDMEDDEVTSDQGRKNENLVWTDNQIDYLVHCLLEQSRNPGMKLRGGGFKGRAMAIIEKKMMDKFGPEFTKEKIRNKLKYVKPNLSICKEILNTTGFSWDPAKRCIDVNDNVWRDYIQRYPDRKKYRNAEKWKHFEEFQEIYGDSDINGDGKGIVNHVNGTPGVLCDTMGRESFTSMFNADSPMHTPAHHDLSSSSDESQGKTKQRKQTDEGEHVLTSIANNMQTLIENSRYYQVGACTKILRKMRSTGEIDIDLHMKALDLLEDKEKTVIFLNLEPEMRVSWLIHKVSQG